MGGIRSKVIEPKPLGDGIAAVIRRVLGLKLAVRPATARISRRVAIAVAVGALVERPEWRVGESSPRDPGCGAGGRDIERRHEPRR